MNTVTSHDEMVFEGLTRPASVLLFQDATVDYKSDSSDDAGDDSAILERYFSDVQNLFLKKFALFASNDQVSEQESHKLRSLLEEMFKVKSLIEKNTKIGP